MKRIYLMLLSSVLLMGSLSCQEKSKEEAKEEQTKSESGVPQMVKEAFQNKYPNEHDPDWEQDDHDYWEAHFKKDGVHYRADFTAEGAWVETENSVKKDEIPDAVKKTIREKYPDREIIEIEHVQSAREGDFYDVEFKQEGKNMDVEIRKDGTVITVEQ